MRLKPGLQVAGFGLAIVFASAWILSPSRAQFGGMGAIGPRVLKEGGPGGPPAGRPLDPIRSAREAGTWLKLHETSLVFPRETPLQDVFKAIREATKGEDEDDPPIPIYVDPVGLQEAEKTLTSPVQWDLEGVPLATSLRLMLKQLGLCYRVHADGLVMVTSLEGEDSPAAPSGLLLQHLSRLTAEVASLRKEVETLRRERGADRPAPPRNPQ